MTKQDRQKLSVLIVLLGVLGLTIVMAYRMNQPPTTAAVQPQEVKTSANPPAASEAHIRLDLLEKSDAAEDIGKRNLFQYRQAPAPPPSHAQRGSVATSLPPPPITPAPAPTVRTPPPPPPIPLKYQGFAVVNSGTGEYTAFLADDARHYNVTKGEILMGRYRVLSISEKIVEIEDLEQNRRQSLPLLQ